MSNRRAVGWAVVGTVAVVVLALLYIGTQWGANRAGPSGESPRAQRESAAGVRASGGERAETAVSNATESALPPEPEGDELAGEELTDILDEEPTPITDRRFEWSDVRNQHELPPDALKSLNEALERYEDIEEISFKCDVWEEGQDPERDEPAMALLVTVKSNNDLTMASLKEDKMLARYVNGTRYIWKGGEPEPVRVDNVEEGLGFKIPSLVSRFSYDSWSDVTLSREVSGEEVEKEALQLKSSHDEAEVLVDPETHDILGITFTHRIKQTGARDEKHRIYCEYLGYEETEVAEGRALRFPRKIHWYYDKKRPQTMTLRDLSVKFKQDKEK